jgi:hypothetical protein
VHLSTEQVRLRSQKSGDWENSGMSMDVIRDLLLAKAESLAMDRVIEDVVRFVKNPTKLEIWSPAYFKQLIQRIQPHE